MKYPMCTNEDSFHLKEEMFFSNKTDCIAKILVAKYKLANIKELTDNLAQTNDNQKE